MKNRNIVLLIIFSLAINLSFGQATTAPGNLWGGTPNEYLGWDNASNTSLRIKHEMPLPINFYTNAGTGTFANQRMTIFDGPSTPFNAGFVGIGITAPQERLSVNGNIHLLNQTSTINLNSGNQIFIANPNTSNILIGIGSGVSITGGMACTYVGENAGASSLNNGGNTYIGWQAGRTTIGAENTFVGSRAGEGTTGNSNVMIGVSAGQLSTAGTGNCFMGVSAGNHNGGNDNVFIGSFSGLTNTSGRHNTFVGTSSGNVNNTGSINAFLGFESGINNTTDNNTFLGGLSGHTNTGSSGEVFCGYRAGFGASGANNTFLGFESGAANTAATGNMFAGYHTGLTNTAANNTFVGMESGVANVSATGLTFLGYHSGYAANNGNNNTFLGYETGAANLDGDENTFCGFNCGKVNTSGKHNTFIGSLAGTANIGNDNSTFVGYQAGTASTGKENTFLGAMSGLHNTTGNQNTFIGRNAGTIISTGTNNTYLGWNTGPSTTTSPYPTLINSAAIGSNAEVLNNNHMIMGDNSVNVGIGLSGNTTGPRSKLEIKSGVSDVSGLQFTNLTSASASTITSYGKVLTVDTNGKVALTNDQGAGTLSICTGGLTLNYITKTTAANTICSSSIYETTSAVPLVGIGVGTAPTAKLDVYNDIQNSGSDYGIKTKSDAGTTPSHAFGLVAEATGYKGYSIGVQAIANAAGDSCGGCGGISRGVDVLVYTNPYTQNYGIYSTITGTGAATGYKSTVTGITGSPSTGADITLSTGSDLVGIALTTTNGSNQNYGVIATNTTNTTSSNSTNRGFEARMDGAADCEGYRSSITNNYASTQENIGYAANINGLGTSSTNYGAQYVVNSSTNGAKNCGVQAWVGSSSYSIPFNTGVFVRCFDAVTNTGIEIESYNNIDNNATNYGLKSQAGGYYGHTASNAYGVYTTATGGTNITYGIYADGGGGSCTSGSCNFAAGYFSGTVYTNTSYQTSDIKLKDSITPIVNASIYLNQLNPVSYKFKTQQYQSMHLNEGNNFGLIAQDLQQILPELVRGFAEPEVKDTLGNIVNPQVDFQAINYIGLVPILIAGFKEQTTIIDSLNTRLTNLEAIVASCCAASRISNPNNGQTEPVQIKLTNIENSILYQNQPNPYTSNTTIRYFIPENVTDVKITFQDATGKNLKEVPVKETGQGSIVIDGSDLINGIYTYSLVVGGRVLDSKKMIKVK